MILYSQVRCQFWLTTKMKYSKSQVVSQRFLNAPTKKRITKNVVVSLKGTDVLVLMFFAYALNEINEN